MSTITMHVIASSDSAAREAIQSATVPAISGTGRTDYSCGSCGSILFRHMFHSQVRNLKVKCPRCQSVNVSPSH